MQRSGAYSLILILAAGDGSMEQGRRSLPQRPAFSVDRRLLAVEQVAAARAERVQEWRQSFPAADAVAELDKHRAQALLQALESSPDPLTVEERSALEPLAAALHAHYDQMSIDEILGRIRRLSETRQRELLGLLTAELRA